MIEQFYSCQHQQYGNMPCIKGCNDKPAKSPTDMLREADTLLKRCRVLLRESRELIQDGFPAHDKDAATLIGQINDLLGD